MEDTMQWYIEDMKDYIITFNEALIELQKNMEQKEVINTIFRVAHSIKSNSASMKLNKIKEVMHTVENILHNVRDDKQSMTKELVELLFSCHDFLEDCVNEILTNQTDENINITPILSWFNQYKLKGQDNPFALENILANKYGLFEYAINKFPFVITQDLYDLIVENRNRGYEVFYIKSVLKTQSLIKANINLKIYNALEAQGYILESNPKKPTQADLLSPDFKFDQGQSDLLVLTKEPVDSIMALLKHSPDIIESDCRMLSNEFLQKVLENKTKEELNNKILKLIEKIKIEALDIKSENDNDSAIERILDILGQIGELIKPSESYYAKMIITKVYDIVRHMGQNKLGFDAAGMQEFVFLCTKLAELVRDPSLEVKKEFINDIEDIVLDLVERCGQQRRKIGDLLIEEGIISEADVQDILDLQKKEYRNLKFGQVAVLGKKVSVDDIVETLLKQNVDHEATKMDSKEYVRISNKKIDEWMVMLNTLKNYQVQLNQVMEKGITDLEATKIVIAKMTEIIDQMDRLSTTLRVVPVKPIFHKLTRITRETAYELGKKIYVVLEGEDTEIDKFTSEKIMDPLTHLVRNAVSHGIEDEDTRLLRGKKREGKVKLSAFNNEGQICIEVSDDGGGMDPKAIYKKGIEKNILDESKQYSEDEILHLIFKPGFSTQEVVNTVSGRGVGMDVVETEIEKISGKVEIINVYGEGCTFIIKIPMLYSEPLRLD